MTGFTLSDLDRIIAARAASDDAGSYTRKLMQKGVGKIAQKVGEEAVEAAIAAVENDREGLTGEVADLLYHLLVLMRARGVSLDEVMAELDRRTAQSGLAEKAARPPE
ncbi:phosphoribosyl-ATP diphosphatase [Stappia indica]|uniref:phosphoribosyl-ATP diphosphatase n=1 Tax=Stappia indica TaxID=538381 RepID=UPI001CD4A0D5|nr:phosphoribosyl-ATP diphosphatase [Stappia indica]MCA1299537.1 phosphoribosyl-ATP diphosphatase [Stappia indica]